MGCSFLRINWIDCFQARIRFWFYTAEQFRNQDSSLVLAVKITDDFFCLGAAVDIYGDCCSMFWPKFVFIQPPKTRGSDAWRLWWILPCFRMFSPLHSGVTGIFELPLFVSTLIFISMKDAGWQLSANINFVFGSSVSEFYSRGFICIKCFSLPHIPGSGKKHSCFSSLDKNNDNALTSSS